MIARQSGGKTKGALARADLRCRMTGKANATRKAVLWLLLASPLCDSFVLSIRPEDRRFRIDLALLAERFAFNSFLKTSR